MEMLKKRWVAVVITLLVIALSICIGLMRAPTGSDLPDTDTVQSLDTSLDIEPYRTWLWDEAGVLSSGTEDALCLYNANWDARYQSLVAVAAVLDTDGQAIEDYAFTLANDIGLTAGTPCWWWTPAPSTPIWPWGTASSPASPAGTCPPCLTRTCTPP